MPTVINLPTGASKKKIENALKTVVFYDFSKSLEDLCGNSTTNTGNVVRDNLGAIFSAGKQLVNDVYLLMTKNYTFELIINIADNSNYQNFLATGGNGGIQVTYNPVNKKIQATRYGIDGLSLVAQTNFTKWNQDVHIAIVKQGNMYRLYIDGVLQATASGTISTTLNLYLSGYVDAHKSYPINGRMKMFKVTQKALNPEEFEKIK